jgi:hypothetical protein
MQPITVIVTTNSGKINNTIESIEKINPKQIIIGSYVPLKNSIQLTGTDHSKNLNDLINLAKHDWIFYLKESEQLIELNDNLDNLEDICSCMILNKDVIVKETRLWNKNTKAQFKNPVFEKLNLQSTQVLDIIIYQEHTVDISKKVDIWKRTNPLAIDVYYYKAFIALGDKKFDEFKSLIAHYLFNTKKLDIPHIMSRYYLSFVQGIIENNIDDAIKNLAICLAENPLMAEFWCLLGDLFVKTNKFEGAIVFYENAMVLGSRRLKLDFWPMHISKYYEYPNEMISQCKKVLEHKSTFS